MNEHCEEVLRRAELLLDGEENLLTKAELIEIKEHLEGCPPCYQDHEFTGRIILRIRSLQGKDRCPDTLRVRMTHLLFEEEL